MTKYYIIETSRFIANSSTLKGNLFRQERKLVSLHIVLGHLVSQTLHSKQKVVNVGHKGIKGCVVISQIRNSSTLKGNLLRQERK